MTLAQTLKQYFDIATETDSALKAVYAESKLDDCEKHIIKQAKKLATDNMAMVESSVRIMNLRLRGRGLSNERFKDC